LGISLFHYEKAEGALVSERAKVLDMRLDPTSGPSAADLVMQLSEADLADLIYQNGEERYSRRIARAIVEARVMGRIEPPMSWLPL